MSELTLHEKLIIIQSELKAPKSKYNQFGKYAYRSVEDIQEALKPHLKKHGLTLVFNDDVVFIGERYYMKPTAVLSDGKDSLEVCGFAREDDKQAGMSGGQLTGSCSSYARKYSLNGMFLLDDNKDADTDSFSNQVKKGQEDKEKEIASQLATFKGVIDKGFITEPDTHDIENLKAELKAVVWLSKTNHVQIGKYFTDSLKAYEQTLKETEVPK